METKPLYKFGSFSADLDERKLWKDGNLVPLTPKVFQTFEVLLKNRERVVSKKELLETIWPDRFVEEGNITQNVSVLRKAFGEGESATKYIATFPGIGYRFIAEVERPETEPIEAVDVQLRPADRRVWWAAAIATIALGLLAAGWLRRERPGPPSLGSRRTITHLPGREYQPTISPDGKRLAFTHHADLTGPVRVAVVDLEKRGAPRFISSATDDAFSPAWSPDGSKVAYLQATGKELRVMIQEDGQPARVLTWLFRDRYGIAHRQLDWSPDGRLLAVSNKNTDDEPFRIELIHIQEGRRTPLTIPPALSDGDFEPRFSPDGKKLAFLRVRSRGSMEVLMVNMPGGDPIALSGNSRTMGGLDWTPDSRSILFTADREGASGLWRIDLVNAAKIWQPVNASADVSQISISRVTGSMVLAAPEPEQNIWKTTLNLKHVSEKWERWIASTKDDYFPAYSPDSRRVAFLSDRTGEQQLWIKDSSGEERQVTFGNLRPSYASWTASGDHLAFSSLRERKLYRLDASNGSLTGVSLPGAVGSHTAISPDGARIFFARRFYILRAPAAGGHPEPLTDQGGSPLRISPDGAWIYYVRHRFSNEIWRSSISDSHAERITDRLQPGCWACWSVNTKSVVYIPKGESEINATLERLDLETHRIESIGSFPARIPPLGKGALALAPDGRSLVAVVSEPGSGDVEIVDSVR